MELGEEFGGGRVEVEIVARGGGAREVYGCGGGKRVFIEDVNCRWAGSWRDVVRCVFECDFPSGRCRLVFLYRLWQLRVVAHGLVFERPVDSSMV